MFGYYVRLNLFCLTILAGNLSEEDLEQMKRTLQDLLLGGVMSGVFVTLSLLQTLVTRLKGLCRTLRPLVPEGLYLPAPPVYCPQPPITQQVLCLHLFNPKTLNVHACKRYSI